MSDQQHDLAPGFKPTKGRQPRTGDAPLRVQYRCGRVDKHTYTAKQLRWTDTGDSFDIIGVQLANAPRKPSEGRQANGSYK